MFWILALGLAALAGLFVAAALRGGGGAPARGAAALAIYRDQLAEIDRDAERGLIPPAEAEAARIEVQRRMLRAGRAGADTSGRARRGPVVAAAVAVPAAGLALYLATGAPGTPSVTLAERAEERAAVAAAAARVRALSARVERAGADADPADRVALASDLMALRRPQEAAAALAPVARRDDAPSGAITYFVEVSLAANGGRVTDAIRADIDRAVRADPLNPAASFYRSYALAAAGDLAAAREGLVRRLSLERTAPPWLPSFVAEIDRLGVELGLPPSDPAVIVGSAPAELMDRVNPPMLPPGGEAVAALPVDERDAMIREMVDGLAARLEEAPDDAEGWLRLARARAVLGDPGAARTALARAAEVADGDPEVTAAIEAMRAEFGE